MLRNLLLTVLLTLGLGCRSDLKVFTKDSGKAGPVADPSVNPNTDDPDQEVPSEEDPNENEVNNTPPTPTLDGEFNFTHTHVQTRSVISLQLNRQIVENGERFTLTNQTTGKTLLDSVEASFPLTQLLSLTNADVLVYNFYPLSSEHASMFTYGENDIRLDILDDANPRFRTAKITMRDFTIFGTSATHFGENVQVKGNFQGWVNYLSSPTVSSGNTILSTGMQNIINR